MRGNRAIYRSLTRDPMTLAHQDLKFLQLLWRLIDPLSFTALWDHGAYQVCLQDSSEHIVALGTRADPTRQLLLPYSKMELPHAGPAGVSLTRTCFYNNGCFKCTRKRSCSALGKHPLFTLSSRAWVVPGAGHDVYNQNPKLRNTSSNHLYP